MKKSLFECTTVEEVKSLFLNKESVPKGLIDSFDAKMKKELMSLFDKVVTDIRLNPETNYFEIKRSDIGDGKWLKSKLKLTQQMSLNDLIEKIKNDKVLKNIMK